MTTTKIPYCDCTWDLTIGCRKRSPGCAHCWATRTVHRLRIKGLSSYTGQTATSGDDWRQTDNVNLLEANLAKPLHWRKPKFIFVNSKSDLFDERVPFSFIAKAFDTMALARQHKFMVLTKEPARMGKFIEWYSMEPGEGGYGGPTRMPNVILMTSIEDAEHLDRWDQLAAIPAAMRGISFEPLIGPVSQAIKPSIKGDFVYVGQPPKPDWIVVGCEKHHGGRAGMWAGQEPGSWWHEAQALRELAQAAQVPFWMKQGPGYFPAERRPVRVTDEVEDFPPSCRIQQHPNWNG